MDHGRTYGGQGKADSGHIDLGNEPPLSVDGADAETVDRRRVSVQWFSGTILTGLCGAALIGGAIFASLDGETNFAMVPERIDSALRGALNTNERTAATLHKGDRLPPLPEAAVSRSVIRKSITSNAGNREIVRVRPYIRVAGNLALSTSELSSKIPAFNPQKLLVESGPGANGDQADIAEPDAEVSFVTRDLAGALPRARIAASVPMEEVMMSVRDMASWANTGGVKYTPASVRPGVRMAYAAEGDIDPYAGFEARVVPENVTLMPKTSQPTPGAATGERSVTVKKGDTVASILREAGATPEEILAIVSALGNRGRDGALREGQKVRVLMAVTGASTRAQPIRVIVGSDTTAEAVAALSDLGRYVAVDVQAMDAPAKTASAAKDDDDDDEDDGSGVRLYQSIWETALRNNVPKAVIEDMIRIYSYDVDFQRKVQAGDSFDVFFAADDENAQGDAKGEVQFASLTVGGETRKYYRFQTTDDGITDFYDETGKSAKKFLVRKPVSYGMMRSPFGARRHPILGYSKMHTGVDWAAPHGTPIYAAGNGIVDTAGWEGGYGKYVRLKHNNGYETAYGHMTAFARGIEPGKRVRQGQVIGFVGSTGLSTGPHVHYEILVNGRFVDPMRIKLPRGRSLEGTMLASFEQVRDQVEGTLGRRNGRLAQNEPAPAAPALARR